MFDRLNHIKICQNKFKTLKCFFHCPTVQMIEKYFMINGIIVLAFFKT